MTAKQRNKTNANTNDKTSSHQDDVAKKPPKPSKAVSGPAAPSPGSGILTKTFAALCYLVLVAAAGFASYYLQQVLEEVHQIRTKNEESVQKSQEVVQRVEYALQQVSSLQASVAGVESALGSVQSDLQGTALLVRRGESETRRVEEALQKLQNELLRDLSAGIGEVKEARERDFSSLERAVEERLAELSRSIGESVAEVGGAQGEVQAQLKELRSKVEHVEDPALLKQELTAITAAVADLHTAGQVAEGNAGVLREQIATVGEQLQTRNREVASLSEEIEALRSLLQSTAGALRQEVSEAQGGFQTINDQLQSLKDGQSRTGDSLQGLESELRAELVKAERREDELELRLRAAEESKEAQGSSTVTLQRRLEELLSRSDTLQSALAAQGKAGERARQTLQEQLQGFGASLAELQAGTAAWEGAISRLEAVEQRLEAQGDSPQSDQGAGPLEALRKAVDRLEAKAKQVEEHEREISALRSSLGKEGRGRLEVE